MDNRSSTWRASFVGVRILALYVIIHALIVAGQDAFFLITTGGAARWWVGVALVGTAVIGVALWLKSAAIATNIETSIGRDSAETIGSEGPSWLSDPRLLLRIGLGLIGVTIAVDGFVGFVATGGPLISVRSQFGPTLDPYYWQLGSYALRAAIGLYLVWRAHLVSA